MRLNMTPMLSGLMILAATDAAAGQTLPPSGRPMSPSERRQQVAAGQRVNRQLDQVRTIADRLGTSSEGLRSALVQRISGNTAITDEELLRLAESAARDVASARSAIASARRDTRTLMANIISMPPSHLETALEANSARAEALLSQGNLTETKRVLAQSVLMAEEAISRGDVAGGRFLMSLLDAEAGIARAEGGPTAAASKYLEALRRLPRLNVLDRWSIALRAADERAREQEGPGSTRAGAAAIHILEDVVLPLVPRERHPSQWALTQSRLGDALQALGHRQGRGGAPRLHQAAAAYRKALEELSCEHSWATTRLNLARTLATIAERSRDIQLLEHALQIARETWTALTAEARANRSPGRTPAERPHTLARETFLQLDRIWQRLAPDRNPLRVAIDPVTGERLIME